MKLIATRDFYNHEKNGVFTVDLSKATGVPPGNHPNVVPMGAIFEIGTAVKANDLEEAEQKLVHILKFSNVIDDATNPKVVAKIQAEVRAKEARKARLAALEKEERLQKERQFGRSDADLATIVAAAVATALAKVNQAPALVRK